MSLKSYVDALRRHLSFSRQEWLGTVITIAVFALIASFTQWGGETFDASEGIRNLFIAVIIVGSGVLVHHLAQKLTAIQLGLKAEIKLWWYGLLGGLLVCLASNGAWTVYLASGVFIHHVPLQRVGKFRYYAGVWEWAKVALSGPLANVLLAGFIKTAQVWLELFNPVLVDQVFTFNLMYAAFSLFPIPPLDGSRVFYASRLVYVFCFASFVSYVAMIVLVGVYSYVFALLIGLASLIAFYYLVER